MLNALLGKPQTLVFSCFIWVFVRVFFSFAWAHLEPNLSFYETYCIPQRHAIQKEDDCTQQHFKSNVWPNGFETEDNENSEFIISIWV